MSDNEVRMSLGRGERVEKVVQHVDGMNLVHDGNSRWLFDGDENSWYFVVNGKYRDAD